MTCGTGCGGVNLEDKKWQDLNGWNGIALKELLHKLGGQPRDEVRVYTVKTTRFVEKSNDVHHEGSGPNLEGGLATLCTCKHSMRLNHTCEDWKGLWILGLTSRAKNRGFSGEHYLLYMMKVKAAFKSQKELYEYLKINNRKSLQIKSVIKNCLGDVYVPAQNCTNSFDPMMYMTPHKNHSHALDGDTQWHEDIIYKTKFAPLLLGDEGNTFVWPKPMIIFDRSRGPGNLKLTLGEDLFSRLKTLE